MINALKYTRTLESVGFSREQAETHVQMMTELVEGSLVTKQDLQTTKQDLQNEMSLFRNDVQNEFAKVRQEMTLLREYLENKIIQSEYRMTIKMGAMLTVAVGVLATLIKLQ